jgi:predicted TIM-barrel fold metal-dependent hydrolase
MRLRPPLASWTDKPQYKEDDTAYIPTRIGFPRAPSAVNRSIDLLLQEMDEAEIQWGVVMGRKSKPPLGVIPNEEIEALIVKYPDRFVSFVGVSVSDPGFVGVSIEPCCSEIPMAADDPRIYPIYELCQSMDVPISISLSTLLTAMSGSPYEFSSPLPLYKAAKDFNKLKMVISHGAWPWVREMLGVAYSFKNVWVSPDLYMLGPDTPGAEDYIKAANMYLFDRTLFGTAYPTRPLVESVQAFDQWSFSPGVRDRILYKNAHDLMRLPGA